MADKNSIFDIHALTNKGMAGNFAICSNRSTFLNLDESAYLGSRSDGTTIKIDQFRMIDNDALTHLNIVSNHCPFLFIMPPSPSIIKRERVISVVGLGYPFKR